MKPESKTESKTESNEVEISLFPIPGSVSLPFSVVPLHIFEPRYRKMITDSVEQKRRIGVAHAIREIAPSKSAPDATIEEVLNTNQETYEAHPVFSAGFAEILEKLPDGRLIVQIQMDSRYEIIEELQQVPYKVVKCRPFEDQSQTESLEEAKRLRALLDERLLKIGDERLAPMRRYVQSPEWKTLSTLEYSFLIYSLVILDPDILQNVLELKSATDRISYLLDVLGNPVYQ